MADKQGGRSMKLFAAMLVGLISVVLDQAATAQSGPPRVYGQYAFMSISQCEAVITTAKDGQGKVTGVASPQSGLISVGNGYITFTPSGPGTGTAVVSNSTIIEGGALRVDGNGFSMQQSAQNGSGAYLFTETNFTFNGQVYQMTASNLLSGIHQTVYLVRLDHTNSNGNPNCLTAITASKR